MPKIRTAHTVGFALRINAVGRCKKVYDWYFSYVIPMWKLISNKITGNTSNEDESIIIIIYSCTRPHQTIKITPCPLHFSKLHPSFHTRRFTMSSRFNRIDCLDCCGRKGRSFMPFSSHQDFFDFGPPATATTTKRTVAGIGIFPPTASRYCENDSM